MTSSSFINQSLARGIIAVLKYGIKFHSIGNVNFASTTRRSEDRILHHLLQAGIGSPENSLVIPDDILPLTLKNGVNSIPIQIHFPDGQLSEFLATE